ncbi:serine-rich adhesin for platelets [Aplysia californica]|uniref:Serine-rich adhesin for platelets n=1 Tax=Aplysia californica TaxID=6500 RepID=A0ABM0K4C5_APLCA|nr:serine-rich adhesin for platelets [Aplysia californica]
MRLFGSPSVLALAALVIVCLLMCETAEGRKKSGSSKKKPSKSRSGSRSSSSSSSVGTGSKSGSSSSRSGSGSSSGSSSGSVGTGSKSGSSSSSSGSGSSSGSLSGSSGSDFQTGSSGKVSSSGSSGTGYYGTGSQWFAKKGKSSSTSKSGSKKKPKSSKGGSDPDSWDSNRSSSKKKKKKSKKTKKKKSSLKSLLSILKKKVKKIIPKGKRLSPTEKIVAWGAVSWLASQKLQNTARFMSSRCRKRFHYCRSNTASVYNDYCSFTRTERNCLVTTGCSKRERRWLDTSACETEDNSTSIVNWNQTSWAANEVLQLSVSLTTPQCQQSFETCRSAYTASDDVGSYCAMIETKRSCLEACTGDERDDMTDAACTRSAVNWEDGSWTVGTRFQLTMILTDPGCQERFEGCRNGYVDSGSVGSYCQMTSRAESCLRENGSCSLTDWENLNDAACNNKSARDLQGSWTKIFLLTSLAGLALRIFG